MSEELKRKLSSRKLWVAVAAFVCAVAALFGVSESAASFENASNASLIFATNSFIVSIVLEFKCKDNRIYPI